MCQISFIIPAYNEAEFITQTILSIRANIPVSYTYEIIVIDHGSKDNTAGLARSQGALVLSAPQAATISELRNIGVANSSGKYLVFIDADTSLTPEWKSNISSILNQIDEMPNLLTGSKRVIPVNSDWLNKSWHFTPPIEYSPGHLGGGHMIMSKTLFDKLGGFSTDHETGEDFEICSRARKNGASIVSHPELKAIHRGIPKSLKYFIRREIWHGRGDSKNLSSVFRSKVTLLSILFVLAHLAFLISILFPQFRGNITPISIITIFSICIVSSIMKTKAFIPKFLVGNTILFYFYYWGRAFSLINTLFCPNGKKHARNT